MQRHFDLMASLEGANMQIEKRSFLGANQKSESLPTGPWHAFTRCSIPPPAAARCRGRFHLSRFASKPSRGGLSNFLHEEHPLIAGGRSDRCELGSSPWTPGQGQVISAGVPKWVANRHILLGHSPGPTRAMLRSSRPHHDGYSRKAFIMGRPYPRKHAMAPKHQITQATPIGQWRCSRDSATAPIPTPRTAHATRTKASRST